MTIQNDPREHTQAVAASISDIRLLLKVKSLPKSADSRRVFIAGGTGYIGSALIPVLLERDHRVRVLVRPGSKAKLPAACEVVFLPQCRNRRTGAWSRGGCGTSRGRHRECMGTRQVYLDGHS